MDIIQSFEAASGDSFGDIISEKKQRGKLKIGLLTCGYFEYWRMYPDGLRAQVEADLQTVTERIEAQVGPTLHSGMVDTLDSADAAGKRFAQEQIDLLILVEGTYIPDFISLHAINYVRHVPLIILSTQTADDIDPDSNYQHSLRNSGIIGVAQLTGTLRKMNRPFKTVVASLHEEEGYKKIRRYALAVRAISDIREANVGVIGHVFRGMYDLELSKTFLKSTFDVNIIYIQSTHLLEEWEAVQPAESKALADSLCKRFKLRGVTGDDVLRACQLAIAMRRLAERFRLDAMCFLDQHYVQKQTRTSARMGASLLMEQHGITTSCEGDLGGLVMMMLMQSISGIPALMGEWGEFDTRTNSCFIIGHGIASSELAVSDEAVTLTRTPEEWGFDGAGLNYEFILKPGPATIGHLLEVSGGYRMLLSPAQSLPYKTLAYDELHALLKVQMPVRDYCEKIFDAGVAHHCIVGLGDMTASLRAVADILGLETLYIE